MRYLFFSALIGLLACNTSSTEKQREVDSAKIDGTRLTDTLPATGSVPPNVTNPQPD